MWDLRHGLHLHHFISCATILDHMDWLDPEKVELVPEDGWILEPTEVTFYEVRVFLTCSSGPAKQQGIHMEFENTPMYNSAYIEGIHNLYEFDCGELSGWMYQVNGWFPQLRLLPLPAAGRGRH